MYYSSALSSTAEQMFDILELIAASECLDNSENNATVVLQHSIRKKTLKYKQIINVLLPKQWPTGQ